MTTSPCLRFKAQINHAVRLVQHHIVALIQHTVVALDAIQQASGSGNHNLTAAAELAALLLDGLAANN